MDNLTEYNNKNNSNSFIDKTQNKFDGLFSEEDTKEIKSIKSKFNDLKIEDKADKINENDKLFK